MSAPKWKLGDMARIAVMMGPRWALIIKHDPSGRMHTVLSDKGYIDYLPDSALLTEEEYFRHCDYMRDDWTGREYREAIERAKTPFLPPEKWEEWKARALAPDAQGPKPRDPDENEKFAAEGPDAEGAN